MRLGLISDVHGNVDALRHALTALDGSVDEILLAGDAMHGYRFSDEIVGIIRERKIRYVRGNHERALLETRRRPTSRLTGTDENWEFLGGVGDRLELDVDGRRLLMIHGSPWPPHDEYLYPNHPYLARVPELDVAFLILGHTHVPMHVRIGSTLVVNPGSIGEPRGGNGNALSFAILDTRTDDISFERFSKPRLVPSTRE